MNSSLFAEPSHPGSETLDPELEQFLASVAERYLDQLLAGESPDRQAILDRHPEIAEVLDRRLQLVERMHRLAGERTTTVEGPPLAQGSAPFGGTPSTFPSDPDLGIGPDGTAPPALRDFHLLRLLGEGSFGQVYLARQRSLGRLVAVKVSQNLGQEARTLARLEHDHIVRIFSETLDPQSNLRVLCMQYVPGPTLAGVIANLAQRPPEEWSGRIFFEALDAVTPNPETTDSSMRQGRKHHADGDFIEAVCWIGARLAEALAHAHRKGILHLDIKPANILIHPSGRVLLADFNMAMEQSQVSRKQVGGTLGYMAPEHLDAFNPALNSPPEAVDQRSDIFSLGVVLFELLTGQRPFPPGPSNLSVDDGLQAMARERRKPAPSPRQLRPEVSITLDRVVRRCLDPDPQRRFQTASDLAQVLTGCSELYRVQRNMPRPGPLTRLAWHHPQLMVIILPILPHLVGALVVFGYTSAWVASHPAREHLELLFGKLALGYSLVVFPLTGTLTYLLSNPVWQTWTRLRNGEAVESFQVTAIRHRALCKPCWGVLLSALGWLPGAFLLPFLVWYLAPEAAGMTVVLHYSLSFLIAGLIALTYTEFVDQFLLLRVAYPILWVDPHQPRKTARKELSGISRRLGVFQVLSGVIPLATGIALMAGLVAANPEQRTSSGYQSYLILVTILIGLGMLGSWLAVLISGRLSRVVNALTGPGAN